MRALQSHLAAGLGLRIWSRVPQDLKLQDRQVFQSRLQFLARQLNPLVHQELAEQIRRHQFSKRWKHLLDRGCACLAQWQCHQMPRHVFRAFRGQFQNQSFIPKPLLAGSVVWCFDSHLNVVRVRFLEPSGCDAHKLATLLKLWNCLAANIAH
ncbi:unannotated protein [freshwater metagenome]|uniref:Unannotated protein n=1 Tax=freshwater metagenome TaxID=449393 RepID=A0A6J6D700_9ZZZZ